LQVRRDKLSKLVEEGRNPFEITKFKRTDWSAQIKDNYESLEGRTVSAAGRLMSKRIQGKAGFCDLMDDRGRIQLYLRMDDLGEEVYGEARKFDIGDIVGVTGTVFRTHKGEISIHCTEIALLAKSLRPLPEKFHGLTDLETRYRQRYARPYSQPGGPAEL
jgi:lysyl-tRNA synthetase class 2